MRLPSVLAISVAVKRSMSASFVHDCLSGQTIARPFLLKRFFSLSSFLLLDEPQPRKTNGEDHHHDQNGVLNHRSDLELMLTDQGLSLIHI